MELVAFVGKDKDNLGQIRALVNKMECEKVLLVKDKNTDDGIESGKCKIVNVDCGKNLTGLRRELQEKLKKELNSDLEVALSIASGNGKEHMALVSALLGIPVGIRLVAFTQNGVEFLS